MEMARAPKLLMLIITAVIALVFFVNRGGSARPRHEVLSMASLHLDDGYILYFQPDEKSEIVASADVLTSLAAEYAAIVENALDGEIVQKYDTLVYGLSFRLEYTEKVFKAIGSESVPSDVVKTTDERLFQYLSSFKADEMKSSGVTMSLERDKTMSTQGEVGGL